MSLSLSLSLSLSGLCVSREREAASNGVITALGSLKAAQEHVHVAQEDLDAAEEKKRDGELDIMLALRAMPGAGGGLSASLAPHQLGHGEILTISVPSSSLSVPATGATASSSSLSGAIPSVSEPEPEFCIAAAAAAFSQMRQELASAPYCWLDGFLGASQCEAVLHEVQDLDAHGQLQEGGVLGGGQTGAATTYTDQGTALSNQYPYRRISSR